jgi:propionate CoA-transferase
MRIVDGNLVIDQEGKVIKFRQKVEHLTFNGPASAPNGIEVMSITERAVFQQEHGHLKLIEIAPGIEVEDLRAKMDCPFVASENLCLMPDFDHFV